MNPKNKSSTIISKNVEELLPTLFPITEVRSFGKKCRSIEISKSYLINRALVSNLDIEPDEPIVRIRGLLAFHHELQEDSRNVNFLFTYGCVCLDARGTGNNPGRFVRRSCFPNSYLSYERNNTEFHIIIKARDFIPYGHEITIDFNDDFFPLNCSLKCTVHLEDSENCRREWKRKYIQNDGYWKPPELSISASSSSTSQIDPEPSKTPFNEEQEKLLKSIINQSKIIPMMPRHTKHLCHVFKQEFGSEKTVEEIDDDLGKLISDFTSRVMKSNIVLNDDRLMNAITLRNVLYVTSVSVEENVLEWLHDAGVNVFLNKNRQLFLMKYSKTDKSPLNVHSLDRKTKDYELYLKEQMTKLLAGMPDESGRETSQAANEVEVQAAMENVEEGEIVPESGNRVFSPLPPPPPPPLEMSRESSPISSVSGKSIKLLTLQLKETMHKKNSFFHSSYVKKEETGIINGESIQVTKKAESSQFSDSSPILLVNPHVHTEAPEPTPKEHMERKWSTTHSGSMGELQRPVTSQSSRKSSRWDVTEEDLKRKLSATSSTHNPRERASVELETRQSEEIQKLQRLVNVIKPRDDSLEGTSNLDAANREIPIEASSTAPLLSRSFQFWRERSKSPDDSAQNHSDLHGTSLKSRPDAQKNPIPQAVAKTMLKFPVSTLDRPVNTKKSMAFGQEAQIMPKSSVFVNNAVKIPQKFVIVKEASSDNPNAAENPVSTQNTVDLHDIPSKTPQQKVTSENRGSGAPNSSEDQQKLDEIAPTTQILPEDPVSVQSRSDVCEVTAETSQKSVGPERIGGDAQSSSENTVSVRNRVDLHGIPSKTPQKLVQSGKSAQSSTENQQQIEMTPEARILSKNPISAQSKTPVKEERPESHSLSESFASTQHPMKISEISENSTQNRSDSSRIGLRSVKLEQIPSRTIKVEEPTDFPSNSEPEAQIPLETRTLEPSEASSVQPEPPIDQEEAENDENPEILTPNSPTIDQDEAQNSDAPDASADSDLPKLEPELERMIDFLVEITEKISVPAIKTDIWKLYQARMKQNVKEECIRQRFMSKLAPIIHRLDNYSIEARVRIIFVLSVKVDADFLKELRKNAVVRVDDEQLITKYVSCNDGGLKLEGNHSMSDRLKNRKRSLDLIKDVDCEKKEAEHDVKKTKKSTSGSENDTDAEETDFHSITERQPKVVENSENRKRASSAKRRLVTSSSEESDQDDRSSRSKTEKQRKIAANEKRSSTASRVRILSDSSDESNREEGPSCSNSKKLTKISGNKKNPAILRKRLLGDSSDKSDKDERTSCPSSKKRPKLAENKKKPPTPKANENTTTSDHSRIETDDIQFEGVYPIEPCAPVSSGMPILSVKTEPRSTEHLSFSYENVAYTQAEFSSTTYACPEPTETISLHDFLTLLRRLLILLQCEELAELARNIKTISETGGDEKIPTNRINSVLDVAFYKIQRKFVVTSSPNSTSAREFLKLFKNLLNLLESRAVDMLLGQVSGKLSELEHVDMNLSIAYIEECVRAILSIFS
ncbi:SET domain-containing protein [Caenorhabditis elegans]|uniref:SET domain-containing protein n=1 Tax=Caenorhabditis elegans TaxID=6239 RepID=K8ESG9_CAEEL|nr:SET domain-containing protein [Caenorhabditis elegans]CCO25620.1 SET domain-containing protein [Caenorhabditis elegans]|eukprot:NP_001263889.1 SET (trithorax/polycomb) domain containing [Caenorhabditis elegans]